MWVAGPAPAGYYGGGGGDGYYRLPGYPMPVVVHPHPSPHQYPAYNYVQTAAQYPYPIQYPYPNYGYPGQPIPIHPHLQNSVHLPLQNMYVGPPLVQQVPVPVTEENQGLTQDQVQAININTPTISSPPHFFPANSRDPEVFQLLESKGMQIKDVEIRWRMLEELEELLCFGSIHPFGSFLTGLGLPSSDVDVCFEDHAMRKKDVVMKLVSYALEREGQPKTKLDSDSGFDFEDDLLDEDDLAKLEKVWKILQVLTHTRVPLITLEHLPSQLRIDISFQSFLSVQNSKLIRFYAFLEPFMGHLCLLVRHWANLHHLMDNRRGLKNYAITLLVLVFLVRRNFVPSVEILQSMVEPQLLTENHFNGNPRVRANSSSSGTVDEEESDNISSYEWNVAFCDDLDTVRDFMKQNGIGVEKIASIGQPGIITVALEFFKMLRRICCLECIVVSLSGEIRASIDFTPNNQDKLPESQLRYSTQVSDEDKLKFASRGQMCVQDPFDLSFNVTYSLDAMHFKSLTNALDRTIAQIEKYTANSDADSNSSSLPLSLFFPDYDDGVDPDTAHLEKNENGAATTGVLEDSPTVTSDLDLDLDIDLPVQNKNANEPSINLSSDSHITNINTEISSLLESAAAAHVQKLQSVQIPVSRSNPNSNPHPMPNSHLQYPVYCIQNPGFYRMNEVITKVPRYRHLLPVTVPVQIPVSLPAVIPLVPVRVRRNNGSSHRKIVSRLMVKPEVETKPKEKDKETENEKQKQKEKDKERQKLREKEKQKQKDKEKERQKHKSKKTHKTCAGIPRLQNQQQQQQRQEKIISPPLFSTVFQTSWTMEQIFHSFCTALNPGGKASLKLFWYEATLDFFMHWIQRSFPVARKSEVDTKLDNYSQSNEDPERFVEVPDACTLTFQLNLDLQLTAIPPDPEPQTVKPPDPIDELIKEMDKTRIAESFWDFSIIVQLVLYPPNDVEDEAGKNVGYTVFHPVTPTVTLTLSENTSVVEEQRSEDKKASRKLLKDRLTTEFPAFALNYVKERFRLSRSAANAKVTPVWGQVVAPTPFDLRTNENGVDSEEEDED